MNKAFLMTIQASNNEPYEPYEFVVGRKVWLEQPSQESLLKTLKEVLPGDVSAEDVLVEGSGCDSSLDEYDVMHYTYTIEEVDIE